MRLIKGDIVDTELSEIIHGCNAQGTMGSGVALAIRNKWPGCYEAYRSELNYYKERFSPAALLGKSIDYTVYNGLGEYKTIHNLITQEHYGRDGSKYATYTSIVIGLVGIAKNSITGTEFAIPKIGCGYGGLDWDIVSELLSEIELMYNVEFWVYDNV